MGGGGGGGGADVCRLCMMDQCAVGIIFAISRHGI